MRRVPPSAPGLLPCNNHSPYVCIGCLNVGQAPRLSVHVKTKSWRVIAPTNPSFVPAAGRGAACPTRYLEPDVYKQVKPEWQPRLFVPTAGQQRNARIPKSNRMPDAPHSVKVETQVVDSIEDLSQNFIRRINMTQIGPRVALAHTA